MDQLEVTGRAEGIAVDLVGELAVPADDEALEVGAVDHRAVPPQPGARAARGGSHAIAPSGATPDAVQRARRSATGRSAGARITRAPRRIA